MGNKQKQIERETRPETTLHDDRGGVTRTSEHAPDTIALELRKLMGDMNDEHEGAMARR